MEHNSEKKSESIFFVWSGLFFSHQVMKAVHVSFFLLKIMFLSRQLISGKEWPPCRSLLYLL